MSAVITYQSFGLNKKGAVFLQPLSLLSEILSHGEAAAENYKAKHADDKATAIYSKYYKRYSARVKVRQIKEADFKKWKYQAMTKRDECINGDITPNEFTEWMESCFPNRKPKK